MSITVSWPEFESASVHSLNWLHSLSGTSVITRLIITAPVYKDKNTFSDCPLTAGSLSCNYVRPQQERTPRAPRGDASANQHVLLHLALLFQSVLGPPAVQYSRWSRPLIPQCYSCWREVISGTIKRLCKQGPWGVIVQHSTGCRQAPLLGLIINASSKSLVRMLVVGCVWAREVLLCNSGVCLNGWGPAKIPLTHGAFCVYTADCYYSAW